MLTRFGALPKFGQDAARALGMNECNAGAARAGARGFVDERSAALLELVESRRKVVDLDADVVEALAALLDELGDTAVLASRADELDASHALAEDGDADLLLRHLFDMRQREA